MIKSLFDNILLHLLAKTLGETVKEKIENFSNIFFIVGSFLTFFGGFLALTTTLLCFFIAFVVGLCLVGFSYWSEGYLKKIAEKYVTIKINKMKEKEIYSANSDIDLSIYTHDRLFDDAGIFTKKPFPHIKLEHFENEKIIIKIRKGKQERTIDGGVAKFLVRNEEEIKNEIATWNVSEEVLVYKIEEVTIIPEFIEKDYKPLPICELEENVQTKIVLTASIDKERVKQIYDKRELDELLTFSPS